MKDPPQYRLVCRDGVWTLLDEGKEYARLLDAKSRADAMQQISEMLLVSNPEQFEAEDPQETANPQDFPHDKTPTWRRT